MGSFLFTALVLFVCAALCLCPHVLLFGFLGMQFRRPMTEEAYDPFSVLGERIEPKMKLLRPLRTLTSQLIVALMYAMEDGTPAQLVLMSGVDLLVPLFTVARPPYLSPWGNLLIQATAVYSSTLYAGVAVSAAGYVTLGTTIGVLAVSWYVAYHVLIFLAVGLALTGQSQAILYRLAWERTGCTADRLEYIFEQNAAVGWIALEGEEADNGGGGLTVEMTQMNPTSSQASRHLTSQYVGGSNYD